MSDFFRREAVDSFSSFSERNKPLNSIRIKQGIASALILACIGAFIIWFFFGDVYETTNAMGIVGYSAQNSGVYATSAGVVKKSLVDVGDRVSSGDQIAIIPDTGLLDLLDERGTKLSNEERQYFYEKYEEESMACAGVNGIVTYICDENIWVEEGDMIAYIMPYNSQYDDMKVSAYLPSTEKELVDLGDKARVMPEYAPSEEYGYIDSYVSNITEFPEKGSTIMEQTGGMIKSLDPEESYIRLEVTMMYSSRSRNRLKWSSYRGEFLNVNVGTQCRIDIILSRSTPYEWLMGGRRRK